jgi:hypothetical protein
MIFRVYRDPHTDVVAAILRLSWTEHEIFQVATLSCTCREAAHGSVIVGSLFIKDKS